MSCCHVGYLDKVLGGGGEKIVFAGSKRGSRGIKNVKDNLSTREEEVGIVEARSGRSDPTQSTLAGIGNTIIITELYHLLQLSCDNGVAFSKLLQALILLLEAGHLRI